MQGDRTVIRELNKNLGLLLVTINQYFLHARILKNWGVEELSEHFYKQSIREMKSADALIERILMLEGLPNLQELGKLLIGENTEEIIKCDLAKEEEKHAALAAAIAACEAQQDYVSRALLEKQKDINEEHIDWLETQQELIAKIGLENYIQLGAQEDLVFILLVYSASTASFPKPFFASFKFVLTLSKLFIISRTEDLASSPKIVETIAPCFTGSTSFNF